MKLDFSTNTSVGNIGYVELDNSDISTAINFKAYDKEGNCITQNFSWSASWETPLAEDDWPTKTRIKNLIEKTLKARAERLANTATE